MMLRGFLAKGWMEKSKEAGVPLPERQMNILQEIIWIGILDPIWQERNDVRHGEENKHGAATDEALNMTIEWCVAYKQDVLRHHNQCLVQIDLTRLAGRRKQTKKRWVKHLDIAHEA